MGTLLIAEQARLTALCLDIVPPNNVSQAVLAATFRHLVFDGTVTRMVPELLRRMHGPTPSSPSLSTAAPVAASTSKPPRRGTSSSTPPPPSADPAPLVAALAAGCLLSRNVIGPFAFAALEHVQSPDAVAAGAAFMEALAQARLCAALAGTLAKAKAATLRSIADGEGAAGGADPAAAAKHAAFLAGLWCGSASLGVLLLRHALLHEPTSAALRDDMAASRLLLGTCDAMSHVLLAVQDGPGGGAPTGMLATEAVSLAVAFTECGADDQRVAAAAAAAGMGNAAAVVAVWRRTARCATLSAVIAEPTFARMMLRALPHFHPFPQAAGAAPTSDAATARHPVNQVVLLQAIKLWLAFADSPAAGPPVEGRRLIAAVGLTAEEVGDAALASGRCSGEVTTTSVRHIFRLLSPDDQLQAYPGLAGHAGQLLDRLGEWYGSGGAIDVFDRGGLGAFAARMSPGACSVLAVGLVLDPSEAGGPGGRELRARCILRVGLIGKAEALLRARVSPSGAASAAPPQRRGSPQCQPDDAAQHAYVAQTACLFAAVAACAVVGDAAEGPPALAAYQALLATARKLVVRGVQEAAAGGSGARRGDGERAQGVPHHFLPCAALHMVLFEKPLQAPQAAAAFRLAVRACALQLLPGLVQGLTAGWLPQPPRPPSGAEEEGLVGTLEVLGLLHVSGLWDVSLAAGVPGLLLGLLRSQRCALSGPSPNLLIVDAATRAAASTLGSPAGHAADAWLREAGRLGLMGELAWWAAAGPGLTAGTRGIPDAAAMTTRLVVAAHQLNSRCQALPLADAAYVVPTWDSCAISTAAEATAAGCVPFLGCWNRSCTNLEGGSEASLKLLRCNNCRAARYCSVACQKQAWAGGHRAACNAGKAKEAAASTSTTV